MAIDLIVVKSEIPIFIHENNVPKSGTIQEPGIVAEMNGEQMIMEYGIPSIQTLVSTLMRTGPSVLSGWQVSDRNIQGAD